LPIPLESAVSHEQLSAKRRVGRDLAVVLGQGVEKEKFAAEAAA